MEPQDQWRLVWRTDRVEECEGKDADRDDLAVRLPDGDRDVNVAFVGNVSRCRCLRPVVYEPGHPEPVADGDSGDEPGHTGTAFEVRSAFGRRVATPVAAARTALAPLACPGLSAFAIRRKWNLDGGCLFGGRTQCVFR